MSKIWPLLKTALYFLVLFCLNFKEIAFCSNKVFFIHFVVKVKQWIMKNLFCMKWADLRRVHRMRIRIANFRIRIRTCSGSCGRIFLLYFTVACKTWLFLPTNNDFYILKWGSLIDRIRIKSGSFLRIRIDIFHRILMVCFIKHLTSGI